MAEQSEDKSRPVLAGVLALMALAGSLFVYQEISLKTSRPIDKEKTTYVVLDEGKVQARLWQDPFKAVETHRLDPAKQGKEQGAPCSTLADFVEKHLTAGIEQSIEVWSGLRVLPVFVDGSPYSSGAESRLNDRYALLSALGVAGYVPESGDYIRFFKWNREIGKECNREIDEKCNRKIDKEKKGSAIQPVVIPVELFQPKAKLQNAKLQNKSDSKPVLILWLKQQDFGEKPLESLNDLVADLNSAFCTAFDKSEELKKKADTCGIDHIYRVLGPRFSTGLSAMLKELQPTPHACLGELKGAKFFSPWATAEVTFLLDDSPHQPACVDTSRIVKERFKKAEIEFTRTIGTDAMLAEHLLQELKRREVELKPCSGPGCNNDKVALISEWDTLYGRALPRTFAAVAMKNGIGADSTELEGKINELRKDKWPDWITQYSYLAGLDGELPAKADEKSKGAAQEKNKTERGNPIAEHEMAQKPEGRSQLDYLLRLAAAMKQEEAVNGEFKAIGILGGDVYDKLLILQALRPTFPQAIFFTTDLDARLAYPDQWQSTRNLIIASQFGLKLQPELQGPIPPFRDGYQTSLFYAALWALDHIVNTDDCGDCFQLNDAGEGPAQKFLKNPPPRLYEVGRHGAFDISLPDSRLYGPDSVNARSIHPPRPDLATAFNPWNGPERVVSALFAIVCLIGVAALISNTVWDRCRSLLSNIRFWLGLSFVGAYIYVLAAWVTERMSDAAGEPFSLSEGISAWPAAAIFLLALVLSCFFLWYSWRELKANERLLACKFNLRKALPHESGSDQSVFSRFLGWKVGLHHWRPQVEEGVDASDLWRACTAYGGIKVVAARVCLQVFVAIAAGMLLLQLLGFPFTPCRGPDCFTAAEYTMYLSVTAMLFLIFYVIDATRICRAWVDCIAEKKIRWPNGRQTRIAREQGQGIDSAKMNPDEKNPANENPAEENPDYLTEWLGIELIAERTRVLGNIIYYPFIIMVLLGIARHTYFDNWDFPIVLIVLFVLTGGLVFFNAFGLRQSAATAKRKAIERLKVQLIGLADHEPDEQQQKRQIEWAINKINDNHQGAFLPFPLHPIFGAAIALPSGGYGLVLLLEYLATAF
ncbi:MAG: hypothetical protein L0H15_02970 [Nitrosospira sp.]|nr:hypothetical protein [Nitrosospira sp.]